ncbi:MAG: hypothetical protein M1833_002897 [Piccolia ochrophora]|nr:MAG: hypothetical protein M1833_002897 [Piccolia ochrophora]
MASHQLAIAKASFSAGLLRPDPTSIPRDDIVHFHTLLENAVIRCSASNIQNCKRWLLQHVLPSPARVTAFGKYLSAFSASIKDSPEARSGATKIPSAKRKRLHILYLLHDVLHHVKYHNAASHGHAAIVSGLQPQVPPLFAAAASFQRCPKHHAKLRRLLDLWEQKKYVGREYAGKLRDVVEHAQSAEQAPIDGTDFVDKDGSAAASNKMPSETDAPYIMPSSHGDPSTPYYDLPAGNMMPHIIPNSSRPIEPQLVKPLQFVQGQADEKLVAVVKDFLQGVDRLYETENHDDEGIVADIDELGQRLIKDEITGQIIAADSYYGWSRAFCEKMKSRGKVGVELEVVEDPAQGLDLRPKMGGEHQERTVGQDIEKSRPADAWEPVHQDQDRRHYDDQEARARIGMPPARGRALRHSTEHDFRTTRTPHHSNRRLHHKRHLSPIQLSLPSS